MDLKILKDIVEIPSPSNYENQIVSYIKQFRFTHFNFSESRKQSCIISYTGKPKQNTILLDAHIDNVHLRVIRVSTDGYVVALPIGFSSITLDGNSVVHMDSGARGAVVTMPPHLKINPKKHKKEVYIDFGGLDFEVLPGDVLLFSPEFYIMNNKYIVANGLDNKASVFVLLTLLNFYDKHIDKLNYNLIVNFSSREEIGYGAFSKIDSNRIDEVIVIDTDFATDSLLISPDLVGKIYSGKGPIISRNHDDDPVLTKKLVSVAKSHNIPFQLSYSSRFGASNNAYYTQFFDSYTQFLGIPLKNMHSPTETVAIRDLEKMLELLIAYLST
jgi:endoglucanase